MVAIHQACFFLILLATITHGLPAGILAGKYLSKRDFKWHNNCPPKYYDMITASYTSSINIASKTAKKLGYVQTFLGFLPERDQATPYERVILQTFEAIYGKVLWDSTEPNHKAKNKAGRERVTHVLDMAKKLASLPTDAALNSQLFMMCDEMFWKYRFSLVTDEKHFYKDTRPDDQGGGRIMQLSGPGCVDKAMGYSWSSKTHRIDNIVLCPVPLAAWDEMKDFGIATFSTISLSVDSIGRMTLGGMMSIWSEGTILHELTHGYYIFSGTNLMADDIPCPSKPEMGSYGWDCITELGRTKPGDSVRNADSFAYFAVALFLDNADWHNGFNEPLPDQGNVYIPRLKPTPSPSPSPTPQSSPTPTPKGS